VLGTSLMRRPLRWRLVTRVDMRGVDMRRFWNGIYSDTLGITARDGYEERLLRDSMEWCSVQGFPLASHMRMST
jgi:hypothetical protein